MTRFQTNCFFIMTAVCASRMSLPALGDDTNRQVFECASQSNRLTPRPGPLPVEGRGRSGSPVQGFDGGISSAKASLDPAGTQTMENARQLTLAEAQRIAFERNWDLLAARSDVDLATAQKIVARQFPNPTLSFSATQISADSHPNSSGVHNALFRPAPGHRRPG